MNELTEFQKEYRRKLREEELEELTKHKNIIFSFKKFMKEKGVELTDDNFNFYRTTGIIASYPNIVGLLHENLVTDKDWLMSFDNLCRNFTKKSFVDGYLFGITPMLMSTLIYPLI